MTDEFEVMRAAGVAYSESDRPPLAASPAQIPSGQREASLIASGRPAAGLELMDSLNFLWLEDASQEWIQAVAKLRGLERLVIKGTSAPDLRPLADLKHLRQLLIWDAPHVSNLSFLAPLATLQMLTLTNFPGVKDFKPLEHLHSLKAFVFGSTAESNLKLKVASLAPLSTLSALQYLSLVGLRTEDQSLTPLFHLKDLQHLSCTVYFPESEFRELRQRNPKLECSWFEFLDLLGSLKRLQPRSMH